MVKQRIECIDNAKGLLILSVVIGHVFPHGTVHDLIYTFHMPAFFIISGLLFNYSRSLRESFLLFLLSRIRGILLPLLFLEALGIVRDVLNYGINQSIWGYTYNLLHLQFNNGGNWFMFCLFVSEILFYLIHKLTQSRFIIGFVGVMSFAIGVILPIDQYYTELFGESLIAFSFLIIGYLLSILFQKENKFALIASVFITIVLTVLNGPIELSAKIINNPLLFLLGSASGTYLVIHVGKKIKLAFISYLGQNTIAVFGTHSLLNFILEKIIPRNNYTLSGVFILVIILFLECPIIYLLNKYVPFLVGKKCQ